MKDYLIWTMAIIAIFISGCSDTFDYAEEQKENLLERGCSYNISQIEAINIANKVLNRDVSRSLYNALPTCEYVVKAKSTRTTSTPDTLAYILNYPNEKGFVIVASTHRVSPVLAFSQEGSFSMENETAKVNFIDNLESYIESSDESNYYELDESAYAACVFSPPSFQLSLSQNSPWDKYVSIEHPGCPVGCVAVATALVMSHAKEKLNVGDREYDFRSIVDAIDRHDNPDDYQFDTSVPNYTYEKAVDEMARLLYWIGKKINTGYTTGGSIAMSGDAYNLCKTMGFSLSSNFNTFNEANVANLLSFNNIIYVEGRPTSGGYNHAWVLDGLQYCYTDINFHIGMTEIFFHCDWGWGGLANGFFSGAVFNPLSGISYRPTSYFAVKKEWKK